MRIYSHIDVEVSGSVFHVAVVASGDSEYPYAVEWHRAGDKEKTCNHTHFAQVHEAERWAEQQIQRKYGA